MTLPLSKLSKRPLSWSDSDSETTDSPKRLAVMAAAKRRQRAVRPAIRFDDEVYVAKPFPRRRSQTSGGDSMTGTPAVRSKRSSYQSVDGIELTRLGSISSCQTLDLFADDAPCLQSDRPFDRLRRESTGATVPCAAADACAFAHKMACAEVCEPRTRRRASSGAPSAALRTAQRCCIERRGWRVSTLEERAGWGELDANVVAACNLLWMSFQPPMCADFCGARHIAVPGSSVRAAE